MEYCMHCGGRLAKQNESKYVCEKCGYDHYVNPKATVGLIVMKDDHTVILARRACEPYKGSLDVIGGFVDQNESLEEALSREVKEELGVSLEEAFDNIRYFNSVALPYPWKGKNVPIVAMQFIATLKPGVELRALDDVASLEEYDLTKDDTPPIEFPFMQKVVADLKKQYATNL